MDKAPVMCHHSGKDRTPHTSMNEEQMKTEFLKFYDSQADAIFRYCLFRVNSRDEALDIAQETWRKVWEAHFSRKKEIENPRSYLFTVARNTLTDWYRKVKPHSLEELTENEEGRAYPEPQDEKA